MAAGKITGTFTGAGVSDAFAPNSEPGDPRGFNIALTGPGVGSVRLEKSFDGGEAWCAITACGFPLYLWDYGGENIAEGAEEPEAGVLYRLRCTSFASGAINYRLSQ